MHPHFIEVGAEAGRGDTTQLVGVRQGLREPGPPSATSGPLPWAQRGWEVAVSSQLGGNMHTLWGQLSVYPLRPGQAVSLSKPQFLIYKWV